jgi:alpha-galactosidase
MPGTALVIGNPQMQDEGWQLHIKSLAGVLPIMLGDPRQLSSGDLKLYRGYADWLQHMQKKHDMMSYRQDLSGFGEPMEGMWDGFQRINTESGSGGIVCVFRQGGFDKSRQVVIKYLDDNEQYVVTEAGGVVISKGTGRQLSTEGFNVTIDKMYDGRIFEVSKE